LLDISISCDGRDAPEAFVARIDAGEAAGAASVWIANHLFMRDPATLASVSLARTTAMRAVLMAVSPFTVHPVQIAMAAATLDEFFPGRVSVCLGVGAPADLKAIDREASKPLAAMREAIEVMRALFGGETVTAENRTFSVRGRKLSAGRRDIPIILAASGPQMLELAGSCADGVLISAGACVEFVKWTLDSVHRGARGRAVRSHGLVYAAVDEEETKAHDRLRHILANLLRGSHHEANLRMAGSVLDQKALNQAIVDGDWARAEAFITDDIVRKHAASGSPDLIHSRIEAYRAAGLDEIVISGARDSDQIAGIIKAVS